MVNDIDTASIRDELSWGVGASAVAHALELCDALDAARAEDQDRYNEYHRQACVYRDRAEAAEAERDEAINAAGHNRSAYLREHARAEAAEAKFEKLTEQYREVVGELLDRAEAAEARINAALAQGHCVDCVHAALTG